MEKYGFKGMEKISDNADREIFGRLPARCQSFRYSYSLFATSWHVQTLRIREIHLETVQHGGMGSCESWRWIHDVIPQRTLQPPVQRARG
jgi:hypothetical protein